MKSADLIDRMLAGESASDVLESVTPGNALAMRKYIRNSSSGLASFLSDRGDLHDFALRLLSNPGSLKLLMKQQDIPVQFKSDVSTILSGLRTR